jgi:hypothetical protein
MARDSGPALTHASAARHAPELIVQTRGDVRSRFPHGQKLALLKITNVNIASGKNKSAVDQ